MSLLRTFLLMFALLAAGGMVSGCGNKGPLYLPDDRAENGK